MKHILWVMLLLSSVLVKGQDIPFKQVPLYAAGVPNSKQDASYKESDANEHASMVSIPTLIPFLPSNNQAKPIGAVIICPGGGYGGLAIVKEGYKVARRFADAGMAAFVLKYRLPSDRIMPDKTIGPLQDGQRAVQLVRENAKRWHIDPKKVGIAGFSAGGHLASYVGTHFEHSLIKAVNGVSVRPDFMLLIYPVISFGKYANKGTKEALIGKNPSTLQIEEYSNELHVTSETPVTFLVHAGDDGVVPVQNSLDFYNRLLENKVPAAMHIYQSGGTWIRTDTSPK